MWLNHKEFTCCFLFHFNIYVNRLGVPNLVDQLKRLTSLNQPSKNLIGLNQKINFKFAFQSKIFGVHVASQSAKVKRTVDHILQCRVNCIETP